MYTPPCFASDEPRTLAAIMRGYPFALLLTVVDGAIVSTHLPVRLDPDRGALGTLEAHVARANPHMRAIAAGEPSTVVFQGPHAYVSPRWYRDPARNVPTWNYAAVHAHGAPRPIEDPAETLALIDRLVREHDRAEPPWSLDEARAHAERIVSGVLAFELPIARLEGKLKLNQNREPEDRRRVARVLEATGAHPEMVALMHALDTAGPADVGEAEDAAHDRR